jgi:hypothetical protein
MRRPPVIFVTWRLENNGKKGAEVFHKFPEQLGAIRIPFRAPLVSRGEMTDGSDELKRRAANCLAVARTTYDPVTRVSLLTMAQRWYDLANGPAVNLDAFVSDVPAVQQQQQIQPGKKNE